MAASNVVKNTYRLFIGNLPWTVSHLELKLYFSQFGHVANARVIFNRDTGMSRHYGFIDVANKETYNTIFAKPVHNLEGRTLSIKPAAD